MIIPAQPTDHQYLTQLTQQSKAHWGYSKEQLKKWEADLTISPDYITTHTVFKLILNSEIVGYYSLKEVNNNTIELDNLFIQPAQIGKGYGGLLLKDAIMKSKQKGHSIMKLYADPHATDFYLKKEFVITGKLETSIPNRYLPIMERKF